MQNNIKSDLCQELRNLLDEWHNLEVNKNATDRDFSRLSIKIRKLTSLLEDLERPQVSK